MLANWVTSTVLTAKKINMDATGAALAQKLTHAGDVAAAAAVAPPLVRRAAGED